MRIINATCTFPRGALPHYAHSRSCRICTYCVCLCVWLAFNSHCALCVVYVTYRTSVHTPPENLLTIKSQQLKPRRLHITNAEPARKVHSAYTLHTYTFVCVVGMCNCNMPLPLKLHARAMCRNTIRERVWCDNHHPSLIAIPSKVYICICSTPANWYLFRNNPGDGDDDNDSCWCTNDVVNQHVDKNSINVHY